LTENKRLKPSDERIISALLATGSQREASRCAGVAESTIRRKLKSSSFMVHYDQARRKAFSMSLGRLQHMTAKACAVIEELLSSSEPGGVRLSAARAVLEYGVKWQELSDIQARVEALEKSMEERR